LSAASIVLAFLFGCFVPPLITDNVWGRFGIAILGGALIGVISALIL
jgi:hypothetical protein